MDRASILGCPVDRLDLGETVARCEQLILEEGSAYQVSINAAKLVAIRDDDRLRDAVVGAEVVSADGQSIVWASRLLADPLPTRVAGIDLMEALLGRCADAGYRVYFLGARQGVLDTAVERIRNRYPSLRVAGAHHGWFPTSEDGRVADSIREAAADVLFVAMSSPRKEYWLAELAERSGVKFAMGVGGALDVMAGAVRRAPVLLQRLGLEWAYRLMQEPRRLAKRYAVTNFLFVRAIAVELIRGRS